MTRKRSRRSRQSTGEKSTDEASGQQDPGTTTKRPEGIPEDVEPSEDVTSTQEAYGGASPNVVNTGGKSKKKKNTRNRQSSGEKSPDEASGQQDPGTERKRPEDIPDVEPSEDVTCTQESYGGARPKIPTVLNTGVKSRKKSRRKSSGGKSANESSGLQDPGTTTKRFEGIPEDVELSEDLTSTQEAYGGARPKIPTVLNTGGKSRKKSRRKSSGGKSANESSGLQDPGTTTKRFEGIPEDVEPSEDVTSTHEGCGEGRPTIPTVVNTGGKSKKKKKKPGQVQCGIEQTEDLTPKEVNENVEPVEEEIFFMPSNPPSEEVLAHHMLQRNENKRFSVGDNIFECFPLAHVLNRTERKFRCDWCLFRRSNLMACDKCYYVSYCSKMCKFLAWNSLHTFECNKLKNLCTGTIDDDLRCLALIIMVLRNPESDKIADRVGRDIVSFAELNSHDEEFQSDAKRAKSLYQAFEILLKYLGEETMVSFDLFTKIFAKFRLHSMPITSGVGKAIGLGLYLGLSAFPHKCCPSTHMSFVGPVLRIKCIKQLEQRHIGLLTVNRFKYLYTTGDERRKFLKRKILIDCECDDCKDNEYEEKSSKILNPATQRNIAQEITKIITDSEGPYPRTINGANVIINELEKALKIMDKVYGPQHIKRLQIMHLLSQFLFDVCSFVRCKEVTRECILHHEFHFGENNPGLIIYVFRLAHTEMFIGERDKAKQLMTKGLQIVSTSFGPDHPFYLCMLSLYNDCETAKWRVGPIMKDCPRNLYDY